MEAINYNFGCRCLVCGTYRLNCMQYETGYDVSGREFGTEPDKFFSRTYRCSTCRTELNLWTVVDTLDPNKLLRKDAEWLESLK